MFTEASAGKAPQSKSRLCVSVSPAAEEAADLTGSLPAKRGGGAKEERAEGCAGVGAKGLSSSHSPALASECCMSAVTMRVYLWAMRSSWELLQERVLSCLLHNIS